MTVTAAVSTSTIQQWVLNKFDTDMVRKELMDLGLDEENINIQLKEFKRLKYAKKQVAGFICLAVGAFLGFISCVLTVLNPVPALYNWILYGLTSIAILVIFMGLYYLFE